MNRSLYFSRFSQFFDKALDIQLSILDNKQEMKNYSMRQAAKKLGLPVSTLSNYVVVKKIPAPQTVATGDIIVYMWTDAEIEHVRQLLPKIANGRKTRYKKQSALSNQQSAKTKAPARVPVPHKSRKPKKK
jgi:predicted DNA-binding transcriptional regulator AlpA